MKNKTILNTKSIFSVIAPGFGFLNLYTLQSEIEKFSSISNFNLEENRGLKIQPVLATCPMSIQRMMGRSTQYIDIKNLEQFRFANGFARLYISSPDRDSSTNGYKQNENRVF